MNYHARVCLFVVAALLGPSAFSETDRSVLYPVLLDGTWGYIDGDGDVVVTPQFANALEFRGGYGLVQVFDRDGEPGTWGFVDGMGRLLGQADWNQPLTPDGYGFGNGLGLVQKKDMWGYIDETGAVTIPLTFDCAEAFSEGLAAVCPPEAEGEGFIDRNGDLVIPARFQWVHRFSEGRAAVVVDDNYGYIDRAGEWVIAPQFSYAEEFSEGLAPVCFGFLKDQRCGYVDRHGTLVIEARFRAAQPFSEGLAAVKVPAPGLNPTPGTWGFMDRDGEFVIEPKYRWVSPFSEGLAAVWTEDKGGYIDRNGNWAIPPKFDMAGSFSEGLASVGFGGCLQEKHFEYIDINGRVVWAPPN